MRTLQIAVYWLIAGSIVFLTWADFSVPSWNTAYFIWDATRDLLFVVAAYNLIPKEQNGRWFLIPVIIYCSIRLLWEIINATMKTGINESQVVNTGFLVLSVGVALLLIKDLKDRHDRWTRNS